MAGQYLVDAEVTILYYSDMFPAERYRKTFLVNFPYNAEEWMLASLMEDKLTVHLLKGIPYSKTDLSVHIHSCERAIDL